MCAILWAGVAGSPGAETSEDQNIMPHGHPGCPERGRPAYNEEVSSAWGPQRSRVTLASLAPGFEASGQGRAVLHLGWIYSGLWACVLGRTVSETHREQNIVLG